MEDLNFVYLHKKNIWFPQCFFTLGHVLFYLKTMAGAVFLHKQYHISISGDIQRCMILADLHTIDFVGKDSICYSHL